MALAANENLNPVATTRTTTKITFKTKTQANKN